jgi:outer membrane protein assembly factor BamB
MPRLSVPPRSLLASLLLLACLAPTLPAAPASPGWQVQWTRQLPPLTPAWEDQPKLEFGTVYRPVCIPTGIVVVGSSQTDRVSGFDLASGEERWRFTCDGPVRLPLAVWKERVYFVSDDGYLYCLDGRRGELLWKVRGGPSDDKVLGNERLISTWPARGGPALAIEDQATVYFAAGIWPFMGIFLHAVDARSGKIRWTQSGDGSQYIKQPHQADAFAGVAPQGSLVVAGDYLLVPGGRSVPACYDRHTGKFVHFKLADNGKRGGGWQVYAAGNLFLNGEAAFELKTGTYLGPMPGIPLYEKGLLHTFQGTRASAFDLGKATRVTKIEKDRKGRPRLRTVWNVPRMQTNQIPAADILTRGPERLYGASKGHVFALSWPLARENKPLWEAKIEGQPLHLLASGNRLLVTTKEGTLWCLGADQVKPRHYPLPKSTPVAATPAARQVRDLLTRTGVQAGYATVWGEDAGDLSAELIRQSDLHVIALAADDQQATRLRERFVANGVYGSRVAVLSEPVLLPPYLASLMVIGKKDDLDTPFLRRVFRSLRPHGGVACFTHPPRHREIFAEVARGKNSLPGLRLQQEDSLVLLSRPGPLPGAANWTHEHADAANTRVSRDTLVKAPLGLLWFGGPGHQGILPRHGHGPQPQVVDGRLIIEGVDMIRALDIYTGRLLWQTALPGVGKAFDNTSHHPGANASGSNYISLPDGIYIAYRDYCLVLDPATGKKIQQFQQVPLPGEKAKPTWQYVNVAGDYLIGGANPAGTEPNRKEGVSVSYRLVVLDRHTGQMVWQATARSGFRHNSVCAGGGRLYAIDRPSKEHLAWLRRRGLPEPTNARLVAFALKTGKVLWQKEDEIFGTWLSYSDQHEVLVEAGRLARDTLPDEPKGMRAYRADTGKVLWSNDKYIGPAMIRGDHILKYRSACDLRTGEPVLREDPLTGENVEWVWSRNYGCNTPAASEHLLTFRSGAAGYFDLCGDSGTGNFGGFRSGCTNNLIVAGGLLNAPDYTRTCTCQYQNQTSLALVPMPEAEMWTFYGPGTSKGTIRRLGVNLGAPGDRKAGDGTLWLDYPSVGGPSPALDLVLEPSEVPVFREHASLVEGEGPKWIVASGVRGLTSLRLGLRIPPPESYSYTVRLHFLEPDGLPAGARQFDLALQGKTVLRQLDISKEAGGPNRPLIKEFKGIRIDDKGLLLTLSPLGKKEPVLSGVEIQREP